MIRDGAKVAYIGDPIDGLEGLEVGDEGIVFNAGNTGSHIQWRKGGRKGEIDLISNEDLVANASTKDHILTDSFDDGLLGFDVRATLDRRGTAGLINALNNEGHMTSFQQYAEEAMQLVAGRIRTDPSFCEVLARLDPDEGAELVEVASVALLRDAFGES